MGIIYDNLSESPTVNATGKYKNFRIKSTSFFDRDFPCGDREFPGGDIDVKVDGNPKRKGDGEFREQGNCCRCRYNYARLRSVSYVSANGGGSFSSSGKNRLLEFCKNKCRWLLDFHYCRFRPNERCDNPRRIVLRRACELFGPRYRR